MIARAALQTRASEWGLTEEVVEKDYVLGWLLWGIGSHPALRDHWVFKGGTCLKKCFVETYRFSEDLDFTVLEDGPLDPDTLLPVLTDMLDRIEQAAGIELNGPFPGRSASARWSLRRRAHLLPGATRYPRRGPRQARPHLRRDSCRDDGPACHRSCL